MKKLTLIFTLLVSTLMFSSPSYAEWRKVQEHSMGSVYIDAKRIRKTGGYVYYWTLGDYLKPMDGILSAKTYRQGECKLLRYKNLSYSFHKEPMGRGVGDVQKPLKSSLDWKIPSPNTSNELVLTVVCSR
jgi:hypothetical protein